MFWVVMGSLNLILDFNHDILSCGSDAKKKSGSMDGHCSLEPP